MQHKDTKCHSAIVSDYNYSCSQHKIFLPSTLFYCESLKRIRCNDLGLQRKKEVELTQVRYSFNSGSIF